MPPLPSPFSSPFPAPFPSNAALLAATRAVTTRRAEETPASPPPQVPLMQVQQVLTSALRPYAPTTPNLPMAQYAVTCVMNWAQAQGYAGAVPTWEINGQDPNAVVWGVVIFQPYAGLAMASVPISALSGFDAGNTVSWGALVQTWATSNGNQLAIPTFQSDGSSVQALVFGADYPALTFYDAPNAQLYLSMLQPGTVGNLQDPAVWANAAMRVASNLGYGAAWPTWQWTKNRGLICLPAFDPGQLPEASSANVALVLQVLKNTVGMLQTAQTTTLADYAGIYNGFTAPPIVDEGFQILMDCLFGAIQIGLNLIPDVGGALASLVSTALTVAEDAASQNGGSGSSCSLLQYQSAFQHATDATINAVTQAHDTLNDNQADPAQLQALWTAPYTDTVSGRTMQLGMLALIDPTVANDMGPWVNASQQLTAQWDTRLMATITGQLYTLQYRSYANSQFKEQHWDGTIASNETPGTGAFATYIADSDGENLSCWFSDLVQEDGYVTTTDWWLQVAGSDDEYPPTSMVQGLFSSDGYGTTTNWIGPFDKQGFYTQTFLPLQQLGGSYTQGWAYGASGNLVTATIVQDNDFGGGTWTLVAGYTDGYGNLNLSTDTKVADFSSATGYSQPVTRNYLSPL